MNVKKVIELRNRIADPDVKLGRFYYKQDNCMCIVGHMLDMAGVLNEEITDGLLNGKSVSSKTLINFAAVEEMFGIDITQLQILQGRNDGAETDDFRKDVMLELLDELVKGSSNEAV